MSSSALCFLKPNPNSNPNPKGRRCTSAVAAITIFPTVPYTGTQMAAPNVYYVRLFVYCYIAVFAKMQFFKISVIL